MTAKNLRLHLTWLHQWRRCPTAHMTHCGSFPWGVGAHARIRTGDLFLTKEMLYRLSYVGAP
jgi:hypothetical protein